MKKQPLVAAALLSTLAVTLLGATWTADSLIRPMAGSNKQRSDLEDDAQRADNPDAALEFRLLTLKDEHGYIPPDGLLRARQHIQGMKAAWQKKRQAQREAGIEPDNVGLGPGNWVWLGPGNVGGRIRSIVIDPTNPSSMFVGSVSGGIWHSADAGASWQPVDDFMADLAVSTIIMDPMNPNVLYAGTGEGFPGPREINFDGSHFIRGAGIFKSTDGGITWNQLASTDPAAPPPVGCGGGGTACQWSYVDRLAISPNGTTLLAATVNSIQRSTDGGATWAAAGGIVGSELDVDFDPGNNQKAIAAGASSAIYSTDGGLNWNFATFNPTPVSGRIELAYAPSNPTIVYATIDQNNGDLFRSTNGGQTYSQVNTGTRFFCATSAPCTNDQGGYDNIVWVNPSDPTFVIVGGIDLWRSTNSGQTFTQISNWGCGPGQPGTGCSDQSAHADQHMIVAHPGFNNTTNKIVYFSNDGGLFRTDDVSTVGQTSGWINLNNHLGITQFFGAAANDNHVATGDPFDFAPIFVGGAQDNGTVGSENGAAWSTVFGGDGGFVAIDPLDANFIYGEYPYLAIFRTTNGITTPANYAYCNPTPSSGSGGPCTGTGITDAGSSSSGANFVAPLILDPNNSNTLLGGSLNLWQSTNIKNTNPGTNNGLPNWQSIKSPYLDGSGNSQPISAIAVALGNSNFIVVGHNDGAIFMTTDGGATPWTRIDNATPARFVTRVLIDTSGSPTRIYAAYGGFQPDNIYRTSNAGTSWSSVTGSGTTALPSVPVRGLAINPWFRDMLYAGTEIGVFVSGDGGTNWDVSQAGPANVAVDELFWVTTRICRLVAATHGRGLYEAIGSLLIPSCSGNVNSAASTCYSQPPSPTGPNWDERANWPNCTVPGPSDDVYIGCPMTVRAGSICRNLNVAHGTILTVNSNLTVLGNLTNDGTITITQPGNITIYHNLTNTGTINGNGQIVTTGTHHFSGTGTFGGFWVRDGHTVYLDSDITVGTGQIFIDQAGGTMASLILNNHNLTFNGTNFFNSSILDLGTGNLNVNGTGLFQTYDGGSVCCNAYGVLGTGTISVQPSDGSLDLYISSTRTNTFQPSLHIVSGTISANVVETIGGSFTLDAGATFDLQSSGLMSVNGDMTINGAVTNSNGSTPPFYFNGGTLTNNGSIVTGFFGLDYNSVSLTQNIAGNGSWSGVSFQVNSGTTATLNNDVTLNFLQFLSIGAGLSPGDHTLTFTGNYFSGSLSGSGIVKLQPSSGSLTMTSFGGISIEPAVELVSGTLHVTSTFFHGPFTVDAGAIVINSSFGATGDVTINGSVTSSNIAFQGSTFRNNGTIDSTYVSFSSPSGLPTAAQSLGGTGAWTGTDSGYLLIYDSSVTTLLNDVTYAGARLYVYGQLNTGPFTLTLPCTVPWDTYSTGDVIGNIRRTNLGACSGAVVYGSPFTTIQFTSGTPPSEVTVKVALGSPAGFPNAVQRSYLITPIGGSGYTATLRLHYLDSELNGNNESTLQLYRNNGTTWNAQGATNRDTTNDWVEYSGVTQFSPWTLSSLTPATPTPTPVATPTPSPMPTPSPTATSTPSAISISGTILYCSNPVPDPVPNVTLTLAGDTSSVVASDSSGNYQFSGLAVGGNYTVTPTKSGLPPATAGINTVDAIAAQRHFLVIGTPLSGCPLTAADVNGDSAVNTVDAIAIQRFFLGLSGGIANVGKYRFTPANRSYSGVTTNQTGQNYNAVIFGDVASGFVYRLEDSSQTEAADGRSVHEIPVVLTTIALPEITVDQSSSKLFAVAVTTSAIDSKDELVGFQGDFTFDARVISFDSEPVQKAGLTAGDWNVSGNVLDGAGPIRTLRVSAYSNKLMALSGSGTLFKLRLRRMSKEAASTALVWAAPPDELLFIDANLQTRRPGSAATGRIMLTR